MRPRRWPGTRPPSVRRNSGTLGALPALSSAAPRSSCMRSVPTTPRRPVPGRRESRVPASRCLWMTPTPSLIAPSPPGQPPERESKSAARPGERTVKVASRIPTATTGRSATSPRYGTLCGRREAERRVVGRVGEFAEAGPDRRHPAVLLQVRGEHRRPRRGLDLLGVELLHLFAPDQPAVAGGAQVSCPLGVPARRDQVALAVVVEHDDRRGAPLSAAAAGHRQPGDDLRVARGEPVADVPQPPRWLAVMQLSHAFSAPPAGTGVVVRRETTCVPQGA